MTLPPRGGQVPAPNRFDRHPLITGTLIAVLIVGLADLIVGSVMYQRERRLVKRGLETERLYRRHHPAYHHDLRPNARVDSALWGDRFYRVRTNSLGFKDASPRVVSLTGVSPRALILGDSFAEGIGVEFDSTFAGHLAAQATQSGIEVMNAGVASYSPVIYWKKAEELLEPARACDHRRLVALYTAASMLRSLGRAHDAIGYGDAALALVDDPRYDPPPFGYVGFWAGLAR